MVKEEDGMDRGESEREERWIDREKQKNIEGAEREGRGERKAERRIESV